MDLEFRLSLLRSSEIGLEVTVDEEVQFRYGAENGVDVEVQVEPGVVQIELAGSKGSQELDLSQGQV